MADLNIAETFKESLKLVIAFFVVSFVLGVVKLDILNQWVRAPAVGLDISAVALIIGVAVSLIVKEMVIDKLLKNTL